LQAQTQRAEASLQQLTAYICRIGSTFVDAKGVLITPTDPAYISDTARLTGILISCASTVYLAQFTAQQRHSIRSQWVAAAKDTLMLPTSTTTDTVLQQYGACALLEKPWQKSTWVTNGLPQCDTECKETAAMLVTLTGNACASSDGCVMLLDPYNITTNWLKSLDTSKDLKTVYAHDTASAIQAIDTAVKSNTALLVEGVDVHNADRVLHAYTTARKQLQQQQQSGQHDDKVSARTVYFSTHQQQFNTSLLTEHTVTLVNMSMAVDGLVELLLQDVLKFTRPDLFDRTQSAATAIAAAHATCVIADQAIKAAMLECAGSVLDDNKLTQRVGASYTAATLLETEQEEKRTIDIAVTAVTDPYSLTAKRVCAAVVAAVKLAVLAAPGIPVITYSAVRNAWNAALQRTRKQELVERNSVMLNSAWELCCHTLPQHAVVQCAIAAAVSLSADTSLAAAWAVVETRPSMLAKVSTVQQSRPAAVSSWLSNNQWQQLLAIEVAAPTVYSGLCASFSTDSERWCDWYACDSQNITYSSTPVQHDETVNKIAFPLMWGQLSDTHLFILAYILNRSGTTANSKCKQFVEKQLGSVQLSKGIATEVVNSLVSSTQSYSQMPIACHASTGVDVFDTIRRFIDNAKSSSSSIRTQVVQWSDTITKATQTVTSALTSGDCLVLNISSCYTLPIWLPAVASTLRDYGIGVDTSHDSSKRSSNADIKMPSTKFRLWIESELKLLDDVSSFDSSSHEASTALQQLLQCSNNVILSSEHDTNQQLQAVCYDTIASTSALSCDEVYAFFTNMELPAQLQTRDTSIGGSTNSRKLGLLPLGSSLIVEVQHLNTLLATASQDIESLRSVLHGHAIMTSTHAAVYNKLQYGHVPQHWLTQMRTRDDSYTTWIELVQNRSLYLSSWLTGSSAPLSYNISTLVEPAGLLSAMQQALAREKGLSVERIELIGEPTAMTSDIDITTAPAEGYYLYGLQLFGGKLLALNNNVESNSSEVSGVVDLLPGEMQCKLPVMWVRTEPLAASTTAVPTATASLEESAATGLMWYKCPIQPCDAGNSYKLDSANTIGHLLLPSTLPTSHWLQKSCTILY
jgi:Dynein heavy chain C-terminal domain/ATP-binding dynein motor region